MKARFQSSFLFVNDISASRRFYEHLLGQEVMEDYGPFVGFAGGFGIWQFSVPGGAPMGTPPAGPLGGQGDTARPLNPAGAGSRQLYFESDEPDALWADLRQAGVPAVQPVQEQPWGQRVFRVIDPDGHVVEVGEPMPAVVRRLLQSGMPEEAVAERTMMPLAMVQQIAERAVEVV